MSPKHLLLVVIPRVGLANWRKRGDAEDGSRAGLGVGVGKEVQPWQSTGVDVLLFSGMTDQVGESAAFVLKFTYNKKVLRSFFYILSFLISRTFFEV